METVVQWVILLVIIGFLVSRFLPAKAVGNITSDEAKKKFNDENVQFIDVRTPSEYKVNYHKAFQNIPLHKLGSVSNELDRDKEVVLICQSGMRSMKAAKLLKKKGFTKLSNVKGGMNSWL